MNGAAVGLRLIALRRGARLSQAEVARRMGTTQSAVSRAETDWTTLPSLDFLDRFARACGRPLRMVLAEPAEPDKAELDRRAALVLGDYTFNPYDRAPDAREEQSLARDGLTRDRFAR